MDAVGGCKEEGDRQSGSEDILEAEECSISSFSLIIYIYSTTVKLVPYTVNLLYHTVSKPCPLQLHILFDQTLQK